MTNRMAFTARSFLLRLALAAAMVFCSSLPLPRRWAEVRRRHQLFRRDHHGPAAGSGRRERSLITPIRAISARSCPTRPPTASSPSAFGQWTSVPTAALTVTSGGQLAEDVNGTNVTLNSDGTISMPADIQPTATGTPIGIVYDYDGSVTDALIGAGAGDSSQCFSNAAFGGNDNYGSFATYQHALIVINGQCAQQSSQLTDVEYRLVRVIGSVLGLGWSQVNPNVHHPHAAAHIRRFRGIPRDALHRSLELRADHVLLPQSLPARHG